MAKLYATLENSKGKTVSISDNEEITATVYDGNMKAYSVIISFTNIGDPEGSEAEGGTPYFGAIITTREWRNREQTNDRRKGKKCECECACRKILDQNTFIKCICGCKNCEADNH